MRNYKINDKYVINMLFGDISHDGHGQFDIFTIIQIMRQKLLNYQNVLNILVMVYFTNKIIGESTE